jgi:hypothetical protein
MDSLRADLLEAQQSSGPKVTECGRRGRGKVSNAETWKDWKAAEVFMTFL